MSSHLFYCIISAVANHLTFSRYCRSLSTGSRSTASGGATPIRKISAQEFEKGGLTKPWVTTVDGTPTFLTQSNNNNSELTGQIRKKSRTDLQSLGNVEKLIAALKITVLIRLFRGGKSF